MVQGGFGACFCRHGTNYIEFWRGRGTSFIGAANLSPVTNLVVGTGAVSRYRLSRSQKTVTMQDLNCGQMSVSGYMNHYKFVLGAEAIKNRDKLIKHTVCVSVKCCLEIYGLIRIFPVKKLMGIVNLSFPMN